MRLQQISFHLYLTTLSRGILLTLVTLEFTQYMCLLLFIRILGALMAKMLDGPQYMWVVSCVFETILECLRTTRPRDRLLALPTRALLLYTFPFLFLSLKVTSTFSRWVYTIGYKHWSPRVV